MTDLKKQPARRPNVTAEQRRTRRSRNKAEDAAGLLDLVRESLDDDLASDVVVIELAGKSTIADFMVIGSGRNTRHIGAMAEHLRERIKAAGLPPAPVEGLKNAEWVLIDGGDVIVHLFRPETRALYNLEKMWGGPWRDPNASGPDDNAPPPEPAGP